MESTSFDQPNPCMPIVTAHQQALAEDRAAEAQPGDAPDGDPAPATAEVPAAGSNVPEPELPEAACEGPDEDEDFPDFETIPMAEEPGDPNEFSGTSERRPADEPLDEAGRAGKNRRLNEDSNIPTFVVEK